MSRLLFSVLMVVFLMVGPIAAAEAKLKALIIDGQNNHGVWPRSTVMMKQYLEESGLFDVDVERTQYTWRGGGQAKFLPLAGAGESQDLPEAKADPDFAPDFAAYDVVISNFGWKAADWPEATQQAFDEYVKNGGGFVTVHAANNSFPSWDAYNRMIGLGGWGGRNHESGPYVYYTNDGELVRDTSPGPGGTHGPRDGENTMIVRVTDHPITQGLPTQWLSAPDECYAKLRGPAEQMTILVTAKDPSPKAPTDRHEPAIMVIDYGDGRIFHTIMGDNVSGFEGVDFITLLLRGAEWAATGEVTTPVPDDFPTADASARRTFEVKPDHNH
ncbi:MAG: ThuA domain-containing protein [Planctomycetota bacterium]